MADNLPVTLNGVKATAQVVTVIPLTGSAGSSAATPTYVQAAPTSFPAGTDRSGTITTGGTAQILAAANSARTYLEGQNLSTGDLWIRETTAGGTLAASAAPPSFRIPAGGVFAARTSDAISIWGATGGQAFSATEG